jgi:Tfp pilus assembly protein PilV
MSISNNKGITLVEVMIAFFLTTVAIVSIMPMFTLAMNSTVKSDYKGRAIGILQKELEFREMQVMQGDVPSESPKNFDDKIVQVSGLTSKEGDATFTIKTKMSKIDDCSWLINVQVTWSGNNNGVKNSMVASIQYNSIT